MKHLCAAGVMLAMLAGPAYSQFNPNANEKEPLQQQYEQKQRDHQETEKAYNEALKRQRTQAPVENTSDPWRSVRPVEQPKTRR